MAARGKSLLLIALVVGVAPWITSRESAAAQKYLNPQFATLTANHKIIALLPFKVSIGTEHMPKDMTVEMLRKTESEEALEFQKQLYARFLEREQNATYTVAIQDVDQTNALLAKARIPLDSLSAHTQDEIAHLLGVDALVSGTVHQSHPTSTGAAITETLLLGFGGSTQRVDINMTVHNGADGALLWSYDHTDKGGISNSVEAMTKSLLKKVAGNFPYRKR
jgi:hypothetical protein